MIQKIVFLLVVFSAPFSSISFAQADPQRMLAAMDHMLRGDSHDMTVELHVQTARWERLYKIRVRMKGLDYAFARVLEPAKVEGQGFLRQDTRLWQYLPSAERTILIPPSLMLDDFMGSDFSNDDFVKMSYMAEDYTGTVLGETELEGFPVYHLELTPNPDAPVTYGKLEVWLRREDSAPVRWDFYNEKMEHIRTLRFSDFRDFGGHTAPAVWSMENLKNEDRRTQVKILEAQYGVDIPDILFTRQELEKYL